MSDSKANVPDSIDETSYEMHRFSSHTILYIANCNIKTSNQMHSLLHKVYHRCRVQVAGGCVICSGEAYINLYSPWCW